MSFALPKAQKLSIFDASTQIPGPGQYNLINVAVSQLAAPFNSSNPKVSTFDCEQTKYGPGYYQNVNIKQLYETKRTFNETSAFASKVKRFKTAPNEITPYRESQVQQQRLKNVATINQETKQRCKERMNDLRTHNRMNRVESIKDNKQFVRVILTVPGNSENPQSLYILKDAHQQSKGPTSYYLNDSLIKKKCLSLADWNKNRQPRFQKDKSFTPGPGSYSLQSNNKNKNRSAAFCYSGMRSHMDSIIYKTNIPLKATLLQQNKVKSLQPGPGHYKNVSTTKKSFHKGNEKFGTKAKRFNTENLKQYKPGPGQYNYDASEIISSKMEFRSTLKDIRKQLFKKNQSDKKRHQNVVSKSLIISDGSNLPPQGFRNAGKNLLYDKDQICNLKERCSSKFGDMSQEPRFKTKSNKNYLPGPGSYENTKAQPQSSQHSHMFASVSDRVVFNPLNDTPFYNVGKNDISSKLNKMKKHIDNLKKINIEQAPFASTTKRFEESRKQATEQKLDEIQNFVKRQRINYQKKRVVDGTNAFKSKSSRKVFVVQKYPGPGQYQYYQQLQKKSFNKNYNYDKLYLHSHIRSHTQD